jgi:hypothetical protein
LPPSFKNAYDALNKVLPGVDATKIKQRVHKLQRANEAQAAYIERLSAAWQGLLNQYKDTDVIPDPRPDSLVDFDLPLYIDVLRANVHKGSL